jgi:tetratricopeptide (TPR) repeat protein
VGSWVPATVTDDIRTLSHALAADPASTVFVQLGELLRQRGELDLAYRVATRGMERHPRLLDAHLLVARIAVDRGDPGQARFEWETVLALAPDHAGALKGLGFLAFRDGDTEAAERHLSAALAVEPGDESLATALRTVRGDSGRAVRAASPPRTTKVVTPPEGEMTAPTPPFAPRPADARTLFAEVVGESAHTALLLDHAGYVVAGGQAGGNGEDRSADIGAQLAGVGDEADRAIRHLGLGRWRQIVFEAGSTSVAMAPAGSGVLLIAVPRSVPLGLVRRILERALERAHRWMERGT